MIYGYKSLYRNCIWILTKSLASCFVKTQILTQTSLIKLGYTQIHNNVYMNQGLLILSAFISSLYPFRKRLNILLNIYKSYYYVFTAHQ